MQIGHVEGASGGFEGHRGRRLLRGGNVARANAGALIDPLIGGIDDPRQFLVGHHPIGQVTAPTDDVGITHHEFVPLSSFYG